MGKRDKVGASAFRTKTSSQSRVPVVSSFSHTRAWLCPCAAAGAIGYYAADSDVVLLAPPKGFYVCSECKTRFAELCVATCARLCLALESTCVTRRDCSGCVCACPCRRCQNCMDPMCVQCFVEYHSKGNLAAHVAGLIQTSAVACCRCSAVSDVLCYGCDEQAYCHLCFRLRHRFAGLIGHPDHKPSPFVS